MKNTQSLSRGGFTLIELMVVITIIGLLASSVLVALGNARAKARDARRTADIRAVMTALELYNNDNVGYPTQVTVPNAFSGSLAIALIPGYLDKLPIDPRGTGVAANAIGVTNTSYEYAYLSVGNSDGYGIQMRYERSPNIAGANDANCVRGVNISATSTSVAMNGLARCK